jgi:hypothetical protein
MLIGLTDDERKPGPGMAPGMSVGTNNTPPVSGVGVGAFKATPPHHRVRPMLGSWDHYDQIPLGEEYLFMMCVAEVL